MQVHYQRSVKRVSERTNKVGSPGYKAFLHIGYEIPKAKTKKDVEDLFAVLARDKPLAVACSILNSAKVLTDYAAEHDPQKWKLSSHWCAWWMREKHLSKPYKITLIAQVYIISMLSQECCHRASPT